MKTPMAEPSKSRTVRPDGEKIARLRKAKLWRVEDLARKAGISVKTVENVEHGANVYMFTLAKFATALGVENSALLAGADPPDDLPKKKRQIEVSLTINIPFDDFDQSAKLISLIEKMKAVVKAHDHIEVTGLMAGSTIITLEMSEADVHSLIAAFMAGKLDEMKVQEVNLRLTHETPIRLRGRRRYRSHQRQAHRENPANALAPDRQTTSGSLKIPKNPKMQPQRKPRPTKTSKSPNASRNG